MSFGCLTDCNESSQIFLDTVKQITLIIDSREITVIPLENVSHRIMIVCQCLIQLNHSVSDFYTYCQIIVLFDEVFDVIVSEIVWIYGSFEFERIVMLFSTVSMIFCSFIFLHELNSVHYALSWMRQVSKLSIYFLLDQRIIWLKIIHTLYFHLHISNTAAFF